MVRNIREADVNSLTNYLETQRFNKKYHTVSDVMVRQTLIQLDQEFPQDNDKIRSTDGVKFVVDLFGWPVYHVRRAYNYVMNNKVIDLIRESHGRHVYNFFDPNSLRLFCALTKVFIQDAQSPYPFKELVPKTRTALGKHELKDKLHDPNQRNNQTTRPNYDQFNKSLRERVSEESALGVVTAEVQPVLPEGFPVFNKRQLKGLKEFDLELFAVRLKRRGVEVIMLDDIQDAINALKVLRALDDVARVNRMGETVIFNPVVEVLTYLEIMRWIDLYRQTSERYPVIKDLEIMYRVLRTRAEKIQSK